MGKRKDNVSGKYHWIPADNPEFNYDELDRKKLDAVAPTVKERLIRNHLSQTWLVDRLAENGVRTCKEELCRALNLRLPGQKALILVKLSDSIVTKYEKAMRG